jgi:hypothetical protein
LCVKHSKTEMKNLEINSDKLTTVGVMLLLALMLMSLISDLHKLIRHDITVRPFNVSDWLVTIFLLFMTPSILRDAEWRRAYPYGLIGFCCTTAILLLRAAAYWFKLPVEVQGSFWIGLTVLEMAASLFILVEGVRWFRKQARWV